MTDAEVLARIKDLEDVNELFKERLDDIGERLKIIEEKLGRLYE